MSTYTTIYLRKEGAKPQPHEVQMYNGNGYYKGTMYRYDEDIPLQTFQNFRSLIDLVDEVHPKYFAPNPNFDKTREANPLYNPEHNGWILYYEEVKAVADLLLPAYKVLLPLGDKAIDAIDHDDWGALTSILGSAAAAKRVKMAFDAATYGTPLYLAPDLFLATKIVKAAETFLFLASGDIPIGEESKEYAVIFNPGC